MLHFYFIHQQEYTHLFIMEHQIVKKGRGINLIHRGFQHSKDKRGRDAQQYWKCINSTDSPDRDDDFLEPQISHAEARCIELEEETCLHFQHRELTSIYRDSG